MRFFNKKKNNKTDPYREIKKLYPEIQKQDILMALAYSLAPEEPSLRCNGAVFADREYIYVIKDGRELARVLLDEVESVNTDLGVGTSYVSLKRKNGEYLLLCRTDMSDSKRAMRETKRFNRILERGDMATFEAKAKSNNMQGENEHGEKKGIKAKLGSVTRLWGLLKKYKFFIFAAMLIFIVVSLLNLALPEINRIITDEYINQKTTETLVVSDYLFIILIMLVVQVLVRLFSVLRSHLLIRASNGMVIDLRNMLFEKIQRLSISQISKRTAGELMRRASHDVNNIQAFLTRSLPTLIEQVLLFVAVGAVFLVNGREVLLILILLPVPIVLLGFTFFFRKVYKLFNKCWQAGSKSNSVLHDIFSGIRVVKSFGMEKKETDRFSSATKEERDLQIKSDTIWYAIMPIMQFLMCFGEFIILFYVGNGILQGDMTLGQMSQFSMYASMLYTPLRMMSHMPREIINFITSTSKVFEIIDEQEVKDGSNSGAKAFEGHIDIDHVSFGYDDGAEVLSNININIKPGEFIGIVGRSGVGKSTLINLIIRMYDVEEGSIKIDGVDIRDIPQEALRSQMGVVLQETFLFSGTVYQNIAYAKPDATRDEIIATAKLAGCHDFIMKLPDGYNTKVGEKGYTMSGGERQRLAIARALLHDPKILILDEATASLDTETEKQIQDALANLSRNRTTIAIAHRLSTLRNATRLVVLDKGRVAEMGTHDELMQKMGIYYGLVMAQRQMSKME